MFQIRREKRSRVMMNLTRAEKESIFDELLRTLESDREEMVTVSHPPGVGRKVECAIRHFLTWKLERTPIPGRREPLDSKYRASFRRVSPVTWGILLIAKEKPAERMT